MDTIEIPDYFICPISLQIMKDPVTAASGITYDRDSIEQWLYSSNNTICPVTKQSLPTGSDLTPNHTLRRLLQAWCTANALDRIPSPKPPLNKFYLINLIRDLTHPNLQINTLNKLETLAADSDRNRIFMAEFGLGKAVLALIVSFYRRREMNTVVEGAIGLLYALRGPLEQVQIGENGEALESLIWALGFDDSVIKSQAACVLKLVTQKNPSHLGSVMRREYLETILGELKGGRLSKQGINSLLSVMLDVCQLPRNRAMMVESGAVFDVIELGLWSGPEKKTTELVLGILYHLCSCADGRAELLNHAAGMAVVTRRILKASSTADDRAVLIVWLISKYSGTIGVVQEMLRVGTVAKLCMVIQADCAAHLKEKARDVLRRHSDVWKHSPCLEVASLTR